MRVLLTGGAGFVGHHIAAELVARKHQVISLDCLTYTSHLDGLSVENICWDFSEPIPTEIVKRIGGVDGIIHNGAVSHVDASLKDPELASRSNAIGTLNILELARALKPSKFVYVSTDEVTGPSAEPRPTGCKLNPTNPYSACKAAGEYLSRSYWRSFGVPAVITRTSNLYGEWQHPEKFVPKIIGKIARKECIDIHADASGKIGSRVWVYAGDQARFLADILESGNPGEVYHLTSGDRLSNLEIAAKVCEAMGSAPLAYRVVRSDRQGYDHSYSIHPSVLASTRLCDALPQTVRWYLDRPEILKEDK